MIAAGEFGAQQLTGAGLVLVTLAGLLIYVTLGRRR